MADVPNRANDPRRKVGNPESIPVFDLDDPTNRNPGYPKEGMDTVVISVGKPKKRRGRPAGFSPDPDQSVHQIQIKPSDGTWSTEYSYKGRGIEAMNHYRGINVGNGYSKRFVVDGRVVHTTTS